MYGRADRRHATWCGEYLVTWRDRFCSSPAGFWIWSREAGWNGPFATLAGMEIQAGIMGPMSVGMRATALAIHDGYLDIAGNRLH